MSADLTDDHYEQDEDEKAAFIDATYDVFCAVRSLEGMKGYTKKLRAITKEKVMEHLCFGLLHSSKMNTCELGITLILDKKSKPIETPDADINVERNTYAKLKQSSVHEVVSQLSDDAKRAIMDWTVNVVAYHLVRELKNQKNDAAVENLQEAIAEMRNRIMQL